MIEKVTWADGSVYEGEIENGKLTGKGKVTSADGEVYEGDFVDSAYHGKGKMIHLQYARIGNRNYL